MIYAQLYRKHPHPARVVAALIGSGHYGTALVTQSMSIPRLHVAAIADSNIDKARSAFAHAGVPPEEIVVCENRGQAIRALPAKRIIVQDPLILMELPIDIIAECTGMPEEGAFHAHEAIRHGKHVAMISKEPDSVVGPILKHLADRAGLVYTQVDGDQHGLLMGWVGWLRSLGLEVVAGGKARDAEIVYEADYSSLFIPRLAGAEAAMAEGPLPVAPADRRYLEFIGCADATACVAERRRITASLRRGQTAAFDLCETVVAANATGLVPATPSLHSPTLRITEIPRVLCLDGEGGILEKSGVIDVVTCLRGAHDAGLGGGVFAVVACANGYSRRILADKGLITNKAQTSAIVYRPHHLCGVETPATLLTAVLLGIPTGNEDYLPRFDMVMETTRDMKTGDVLDCERDHTLRASLVPAVVIGPDSLVPAHLGTGRRLMRDVPAGTPLTCGMVDLPEDSFLLKLRRQQDAHFLTAPVE